MAAILKRIPGDVTASAAKAVWQNPQNAADIAADALHVLAAASKANLRFFNGKAPKCLLSGLFYLLGFRHGTVRTQREIADFLCTTEASVRTSYKSWLREFPEFFTDVVVKLPWTASASLFLREIAVERELAQASQ